SCPAGVPGRYGRIAEVTVLVIPAALLKLKEVLTTSRSVVFDLCRFPGIPGSHHRGHRTAGALDQGDGSGLSRVEARTGGARVNESARGRSHQRHDPGRRGRRLNAL